MMWARIHDLTKVLGLLLGGFGIGVWTESANDQAASLPWLHQQQQALVKAQKQDIPKLKAQVACEHWAHEVAKELAVNANKTATDVPVEFIPECDHSHTP